MNFLFIESWFSAPVAKAIGWTLVHSLWQGLLLTFIAGILIMLTRRSRSALRYNLLSFLLVAFIAGTVITFILELQTGQQTSESITKASVTGTATNFSLPVSSEPIPVQNTSDQSSILSLFHFEEFTGYFNTHASLIVTIWFLIFLFKCIRLTAHIGYAQRLRHYKTSSLPELQKRLEQLAVLMKVKAGILILESNIVKVPSVIGFLKPVILIPAGLLSNLPPEQVEAILLHELAHIRRKDYLVNLLQCLAETIFFFNPSVLWLSSLIRQERENCCDDMAISVIGKKSTYVHALVAFQEYSADSLYVPAFPGEKYPVLQRIKRIVYNNNKNLNNMEKIFLGSSIILSVMLVFTFSSISAQPVKPNEQVKPKTTEVREATRRDTLPEKAEDDINQLIKKFRETKDTTKFTGTITSHQDGKTYTIIVKDGIVKGLFIDSERIADEKFGDYKAITDKLIADHYISEEKKLKMEKAKAQAESNKFAYEKEKGRTEVAKQQMKYEQDEQKKKIESSKKEKEFKFKEGDDFKLKGEKEFNLKSEKEFDLKNKKEFELKRKQKEFKIKKENEKEKENEIKHKEKEKEYQEKRKEAIEDQKEQQENEKERKREIKKDQEKLDKKNNELNKKQKELNKEQQELNKKQEELNKKRKPDTGNKKSVEYSGEIEINEEKVVINDTEIKVNEKIGNVYVEENGPKKPNISSRAEGGKRTEKPRQPTPASKPQQRASPNEPGKGKRTALFENPELKVFNETEIKILSDLEKIEPINKNFITFELNNREMRVNGVKKNNGMYETFKKKYLNGDSHRIFFTSYNHSEN